VGVTLLRNVGGPPIIGSWLAPDYEVGEAPDQLSMLLYISIHIMDTTHICMSILLSMSVCMAIWIVHYLIPPNLNLNTCWRFKSFGMLCYLN